MNKKRILIIADSNLSNSGVPMVFMSIVRALHDEYVFDVVITDDKDMFYEEEFLSYGGRIILFNRKAPNSKAKKMMWMVFKLKKTIKNFCDNNLEPEKYYAIHSFDELYSSYFFKIFRDRGVKYRIIHICAAFRAYKNKFMLKQYLLEYDRRKTFKYCTSIACSSDSTLRFNNYKNKGITLYRTYDEKKFPGVVDCVHNKLVLVQIGTFSSRKNQLFSLKIIGFIKKQYPEATLYFVGKELEEGYKSKMDHYIRSNNLIENVFYIGTSPDRIELSKQTSYILHPSTMEGSGNVIVESQVCGIHCFASDTLPDGYNLGNVQFLKLDYELWAKEIIAFFKKYGNQRINPINKEKFSLDNFKTTVQNMMSDK